MRAAGQRSCNASSASRARPMPLIGIIINLTPTATTGSHIRFLNEKTALDNRALLVLRAHLNGEGLLCNIINYFASMTGLAFQLLPFAITDFSIP